MDDDIQGDIELSRWRIDNKVLPYLREHSWQWLGECVHTDARTDMEEKIDTICVNHLEPDRPITIAFRCQSEKYLGMGIGGGNTSTYKYTEINRFRNFSLSHVDVSVHCYMNDSHDILAMAAILGYDLRYRIRWDEEKWLPRLGKPNIFKAPSWSKYPRCFQVISPAPLFMP